MELEIEGFGKSSNGKSLLSALLKPSPLQASSLLKKKETHSERFTNLKTFDESDYNMLFSNTGKRGKANQDDDEPDNFYERSIGQQEEEEDAIKFLKRPKYMAGPRESDEGEDSMADDVEIEADDLE
jgi:hypothetical protein